MTLQLITVHADGTLSQYETPEPLDWSIAQRLAERLKRKGIYQDVRIITVQTKREGN